MDLNSSNRGCARLGGEVAPPLGVVIEEVAVLVIPVRRHRRVVGAAVRRAVDDEAVCPQAFWVRCLHMPLVRLASSL